MGMGGGAALGSWASGLLYQLTGGYVASFLLSAVCAFAGMVSFWAFRSLREERIMHDVEKDPLASSNARWR
jgi:hypothetical protein